MSKVIKLESQSISDPISDVPSSNEPEQETQKQKQERYLQNKQYKAYINEQIANLKPAVELSELKARYAKATYENYVYGIKLNEIQNGPNNKEEVKQEEKTSTQEDTSNEENQTQVINMNQSDTKEDESK